MVAGVAIAEFMTIMNFFFVFSSKEAEVQPCGPSLARAELEKKHHSGYHDSNHFSNKTTQYFRWKAMKASVSSSRNFVIFYQRLVYVFLLMSAFIPRVPIQIYLPWTE